MGKFSNLLSAQPKGKVGAWVFARVKGQTVAKAYQPEVNFPGTPAQLFTLQKMRLIVALFRQVAAAVNKGFRNTPNPRSPYNEFVRVNNPEAMSGGNAQNAAIVFANVKMSTGTIGQTPIATSVVDISDADATITWDDTLVPLGSAPSDLATVVFYNLDRGDAVVGVDAADRSAGTATQPIPQGWEAGDIIHSYLFFSSIVTDAVSDSAYTGVVATA